MLKRLRSIIFDNFVIKLFSLLFAMLLWIYASTRVQSETNFVVPLELRDIPAGMMVVGDAPGFVEVRLKGEEAYIKGLSYREVGASISLKGAAAGESVYYLSPSDIKSPRNVTISRVSPVEVKLRLDRTLRKELSVRPRTTGKPASGFILEGVKLEPEKVMATGPRAQMNRLKEVEAEPVDIEGLKGGFEKQVSLIQPESADVRLETGKVNVVVNIEKKR